MKIHILLVALALSASGAANAQSQFADANGYARGDFQIGCGTCPHFQLTLSGTPVQDVNNPLTAQVDYLGQPLRDANNAPYSLGGEVEYHASAALEGALPRPVLGAYARADNVPVVVLADPDQIEIGIDLYAATAEARTWQTFTYLGTTSATYSFDFHVDGSLSSTRASAFASAGLYRGAHPNLETGLIAFGYSDHSGTGQLFDPQTFSDDFSVSLTVDPGATFVLISSLSASVQMDYNTTDVVADAFHTMRMTGIGGGDASLLVAVVPEPGTALLMALGSIALIVWRRRQV